MFGPKLKIFLKLASISLSGLGLGVGLMVASQKMLPKTHRSIASTKVDFKPNRLVLGKHAAAMNLEIIGPESFPEDDSSIVELVGYVTQNLDADSWLEYTWTLPPEVQLVQGAISGSFERLPLGHPTEIRILVSGFSNKTQKLISLSSRLEKNQQPLSASAIIVSRPEDTPENRVMILQAKAAEDSKGE